MFGDRRPRRGAYLFEVKPSPSEKACWQRVAELGHEGQVPV